MLFVGIGVLWGGYTVMWWGWCALTTRVRPPNQWPSLTDLVVPGRTVAPPYNSLNDIPATVSGQTDVIPPSLAPLAPGSNAGAQVAGGTVPGGTTPGQPGSSPGFGGSLIPSVPGSQVA